MFKILICLYYVVFVTASDSPVKKAILKELDLLLDERGLEKLADYVKIQKQESLAVQCLDDENVADSCPHWAAAEGNTGCKRFPAMMEKYCPKTCNLCRPPAPAIPDLPPCAHTPFGCCWDNKTIAKGPTDDFTASQCPPCLDRQSKRFCKYFKEDCTSLREGQGDDMRRLCPTTCGVNCDINLNANNCKDKSTFCKNWSLGRKCATEEEKMRVFCPLTCGFCS